MSDEHSKEQALAIFPAKMLDGLARQRAIDGGAQAELAWLREGPSLRGRLMTFLHQEHPGTSPDLADEIVTAAILVIIGPVADVLTEDGPRQAHPPIGSPPRSNRGAAGPVE